jgi:hypothetical protein
MNADYQGKNSAIVLVMTFILFHLRMCFIPEYADDEVVDAMGKVVEPENRFAFIVSSIAIDQVLFKSYRKGVSSIFVTEENVSNEFLGMMMHIALRDIIRLKASQYIESGILSKYYLKAFYKESFMSKQDAIGPQVLTLQHLSAGFVVICGLLILSLAVFVAEFLPKLLKKLKECVEVCLVCYIVIKFTRMNKML